MISGIGCDIVCIDRITKLLANKENQFLDKVFTKTEIAKSPENESKRSSYFAKRFAAKEAFSKALGTGIGAEIMFHEIEVLNNEIGKPYFKFANDKYSQFKVHLSLSDEKTHAVAFVIIER